jgi:hypothetical protein
MKNMELFYSGGGRSNPDFQYKVRVEKVTTEMFDWCSNYDSEERSFRRWYVEWNRNRGPGYDVVQFEWEQAAIMFALKFGVK